MNLRNRTKIDLPKIKSDLEKLGVSQGDTILVRADLGKIGRLEKGAQTFISALLSAVGETGTIVSLAYTHSHITRNLEKFAPFESSTPSFAGALANALIKNPQSFRSSHPTNSVVAVGRLAKEITEKHTPSSPAYEPVRDIIENNGKCIVVGCVDSSPGFTTSHLAEYDTGLYKRIIMPWLNRVRYVDGDDNIKEFKRRDMGMCSKSFSKFYSHYVTHGILATGFVGNAYSIMSDAREVYDIDIAIMSKNPKFNTCENPKCFVCNARRWDRLHRMPIYLGHIVARKFIKLFKK